MLGLEFAEGGTNSVVRRKTLFESAELADWLRNFLFHLNGPGLRGANPAAQIFYVPYSEDVTLTRAGEAGSLLSMGYARQTPYYIVRSCGYLTRRGGRGPPSVT